MKSKLKKIWKIIGPGFITGASDDDPSGVATYFQTGAKFGYTQLWTALFSFPFMVAIQEMCGRIGLITGKGLASVIKSNFSRKILYGSVFLLAIANIINIGADFGAMAASLQLLFDIPFAILLIGLTFFIVVLEIYVPYKNYNSILKYLCLFLFAYVFTAFLIKQDWIEVVYHLFVPKIFFSKEYFLNIVAILGTTISPYLFFWQTDEEVEEEVKKHELVAMGKGTPHFTKKDVGTMRYDTGMGMFLSNLIMFFIILMAAVTFNIEGISNIETANQAAEILRPLAGEFTFLIFTIGIIGVGLLAVPVLAGSVSYAVSEAMGWKEGLYLKFRRAKGFYGVIIVACAIGLFLNFLPIPPFKMLYYAAAFNGVLASPLIIIILLIANKKEIMGKYKNSWVSNTLGIIIAGLMFICSIGLIISLL